jgi:hypothetical protein
MRRFHPTVILFAAANNVIVALDLDALDVAVGIPTVISVSLPGRPADGGCAPGQPPCQASAARRSKPTAKDA